eukprot:CAMPEP_0197841164 /NCGR_PEP_ID=MMETSP1437-20131217/46021_1 /TAXON_ID=49252 ORGANISM="Eucampia antarctica, Strain CCMP1452" /NCGR_SAMPLE_ID=MMETSP1437 /ASSEMBLY_ACC=CAM_ASM_001096 /LENGTH=157 /DNA_ID=CAMNT_0043450875 /DNA_START=435 /DNA_END=904 /DNA_ORIENTATION=-
MTLEEEKEEVGTNPWKDARISTVPLDFAIILANKGKLGGAYFKIAPAENDIKDALEVDKSVDDLSEGKVPLFYFDKFELSSSSGKSTTKETQIPLYFRKSQLLEEWKKQNRNENYPDVKVTELFSVITEMVKPNNNNSTDSDKDLEYLVFIPPKESS